MAVAVVDLSGLSGSEALSRAAADRCNTLHCCDSKVRRPVSGARVASSSELRFVHQPWEVGCLRTCRHEREVRIGQPQGIRGVRWGCEGEHLDERA